MASDVNCILCDEPMGSEPSVAATQPMHRICGLRDVLGGAGHLIDHSFYCEILHDPDAGLPRRLSALIVEAFVKYYGVDEVSRMGLVNP